MKVVELIQDIEDILETAGGRPALLVAARGRGPVSDLHLGKASP